MYKTQSGEDYCIFCHQVYISPLCECLAIRSVQPVLIENVEKPLDIEIKIPNQYFQKQNEPDYIKIRRFIALNRYSYCQEATCTFSPQVSNHLDLMSWTS